MTKEIPLTQGQVALVDDEDFEWLSQWKWRAKLNKKTYYAVRSSSKILGRSKTIFMHREIMKTPQGMECDHIHFQTLDNRKSELRNVTGYQNSLNKRHVANKLGVAGVQKKGNKYRAEIKRNGVRTYLGTFETIEEAEQVYKTSKSEHLASVFSSTITVSSPSPVIQRVTTAK